MSNTTSDFLVIGAGIIGITVALALKRRHGGRVLIVEKEPIAGYHASGRNSGVLHAGVYYKAGTLKARLCVEGNRAMRQYCRDRGIPTNVAGKVIVARAPNELPVLEELYQRAIANGVTVSWLDEQALADVEPSARTCQKALYVQGTEVVDPREVVRRLAADAQQAGIDFKLGCAWEGPVAPGKEMTSQGSIAYGHLVNCAGAYADKVAHAHDVGTDYHILPFRGGYYWLTSDSSVKVRGNIYPVPDLRNPFLGVHFTARPDGRVTVGPTALPLAGREQYHGLSGVSIRDGLHMAGFLFRLFSRNVDHFRGLALNELMKLNQGGFYREAQSLVRGLRFNDLVRGKESGIRAQLSNRKTGVLVDDFLLAKGKDSTHVLNAVSPAFTSSLPFAEYVVDCMQG